MRTSIVLLALFAAASPLMAQSEEQLRNYFEGKSVIVKLEMPGSEDGVDVYPDRAQMIDFPRHASRLKDFGTSLKRGQEVLITKVKVKKDLIEFQLGGGGYGTFGDDASPYISVPSAPKTTREKNLEKDIKVTKDPKLLRQMKEELDELRKEREREDARNRAEAEQARQVKEANIRQRRAESGSRFNIRYKPVVPSEAVTPEGIMAALAEYVDFAPLGGGVKASGVSAGKPDDLRKGLTADQVDALLGRPESISQKMEGTLSVSISSYRKDARTISAEFVEGVLVRYTIKSQ
jgi:hypothetical protein